MSRAAATPALERKGQCQILRSITINISRKPYRSRYRLGLTFLAVEGSIFEFIKDIFDVSFSSVSLFSFSFSIFFCYYFYRVI